MADLAPVRNTIAFAASYAAAARHTIRHHAVTGLRWAGLLPQPVADHQVVILAGRVEELVHPKGCDETWCPVDDALSREDGQLPAGVFLAVPLGDGLVGLDIALGGGR